MELKKIIAQELSRITRIDSEQIYGYIETPPDKNMGDFAFPCFKLAKELRKAPPQIANDLKAQINLIDSIERVEVAGGYLNFFVNKDFTIKNVLEVIYANKENYGGSKTGEGKTITIDYSSPNIAKPFHIGHLRSTVIGGALYKIFKFLGYNVIGINHLGDWGTQFGKLMCAYRLWGDKETIDKDPIKELLKIYVKFSSEAKEKPELEDEARAWFKKLEDGDKEAHELWEWFRAISIKEFERTYKMLNIQFDSYNGEAFYTDKMDRVIVELEQKGLLEDSQGAKVVNLEKYNMIPCLVKKADGATIYATRDLAAAIYRMETYNFYKNLYVVGAPQELHFRQIFKTLELMGYEKSKDCHHIPFGQVLFEGKKLATREGNVVFLEDVLKEAIQKVSGIIEEKNPNLEDKEEVAKSVGIGAIIFNDLSSNRIKDEVFNWETAFSFEGETGPYVQFGYVRTQSVLRKAGYIPEISSIDFSILSDEHSIEVIKVLGGFSETVMQASEKFEPSFITRYVIDLAQAYSKFYTFNPILNEDKKVQDARLALTYCTGIVIKSALGLLGIDAPEKM